MCIRAGRHIGWGKVFDMVEVTFGGAVRQMRRCFCLMLPVLILGLAAQAATPAMTTVSDTIYRADGRPAGGTVLISWPAFSTAGGAAIAASTKSMALGAQGVLSVDLVPNAGATPAGTYYSVVFHLDEATGQAWTGDYETWSDFLPGDAQDIFPGDALNVSAPSRGASFRGIVREVQIEVRDLAGDHARYKIHFADELAEPLSFAFETGYVSDISQVATSAVSEVGSIFLADLTSAEITAVSSTTVTLDCGVSPPENGAFEVRRTDFGWGASNDRNLVGRFATRSFTVPRLSRVQDYYIRQYGGASPVRYSRFSAALHLDYPL